MLALTRHCSVFLTTLRFLTSIAISRWTLQSFHSIEIHHLYSQGNALCLLHSLFSIIFYLFRLLTLTVKISFYVFLFLFFPTTVHTYVVFAAFVVFVASRGDTVPLCSTDCSELPYHYAFCISFTPMLSTCTRSLFCQNSKTSLVVYDVLSFM